MQKEEGTFNSATSSRELKSTHRGAQLCEWGDKSHTVVISPSSTGKTVTESYDKEHIMKFMCELG